MIVITDKMKDAMHDDPVELILELSSIVDRILPYSIHTDEEVSGKFVPFTVIESYDVCKVIMLEVLLIYIQYIIIGTEYNGDVSDTADLALGDKAEPSVIQGLTFKNEISVFEIV